MWVYDDGGRVAAGFKGSTGDCGVRSIAIALVLPYQKVYDDVFAVQRAWVARRPGSTKNASPRAGVFREVMDAYLSDCGWEWTPTMAIGKGTTVHLRGDELPAGRLIARCSRHFVAVIDGVIRDTHDSTRDGTRAVYGYWAPASV